MYVYSVQNHIKRRAICVPAQQHIDSNIGTYRSRIRIYRHRRRAGNGEVEVHMDVYIWCTMYIDKLCIRAGSLKYVLEYHFSQSKAV